MLNQHSRTTQIAAGGSATIPGVLAAAARRDPSGIAGDDRNRRFTFAELDALATRIAAAFVAAGVEHGDRVAIWAPNSLDWIAAALGALSAGAAIVPLNTRFKGEEARFVLERSGARILIAASRFLGVSYPDLLAGLELPALRRIVRLDTLEDQPGEWERFLAQATPDHLLEAIARRAALSPNDVSDIMFTSGTTGEPKGVVTTHGQNIRVYDIWGKAAGVRPGDRYLVLWPFFHCSGYKSGWLASLIHGVTVYPFPVLDIGKLLDLVHDARITVLPGPPTLFQALLAEPKARRGAALASLRVSVTGATSVAPSLIARMREELGISTVLTAYGLTETCGTVTVTDAGDDPEIVATTVGRAIPGVELRVVDSLGGDLPLGEAGEVLVRGYNVMQGFYESPEETAKVLDAAGWLRTGDVGVLDARGYLRITDRLKDMYISGGFNCYPAEIEKIMSGNPDLAQVSVIGVADERLGEVGKAFVVPRQGTEPVPQNIIAWCRDHMANFKAPRYVEIVEALPVNATGKVQKFRLDRSPRSRALGQI
jgi:acyl-CoA synthetase (AMP-forming)/AMP-acid ligase II